MDNTNSARVSLRLDPTLKIELRDLAERNHRSLNSEIETALEAHVARPAEMYRETT